MLHAHDFCTIILTNVSFDVFACSFLLVFDLPKSLLKIIISDITRKSASEASARKIESYLTLNVTFVNVS